MNTSTLPRLSRSLIGAGLLTISAAMAHASLIYETGFTGSAGPFETAQGYEDWHVHRNPVAIPTTLTLNGDGLLEITNPQGSSSNSLFGGAIYTGHTAIADGQVSGVFEYEANGNLSSGFFARIQNPTDNGARPLGYYAGILRYNRDGSGNKTYLVIAKDIEFANVSNFLIASVEISVTSGNYYRMEFDFEGDSLTANLFNATGEQLIKTLSVIDNTYASGAVGLRVYFGVSDRSLGFDSFKVTAIPEPSTALLLLPTGLLALHFFRKNQAR